MPFELMRNTRRRSLLICSISACLLATIPQQAPAATCDRLFGTATSYLTRPYPVGITVGDFNRDGILDLAAANSDHPNGGAMSSISVLRGLPGAGGAPSGTFAPAVNFPGGTSPFGIVAADLNSDGVLDLAATDFLANRVSILIGAGNGTFAAPSFYATGAAPFYLVAEDFDEDGITDLAVADNGSANLAVLIGQGSGGVGTGAFSAPVFYPLDVNPTSILARDFNEDGILDLVVTCHNAGRVAVLLGRGSAGQGDGTFSPAVFYSGTPLPFSVTAADFNGDGILDLATGDAASGGVAISLGRGSGGVGDGTFDAPVVINSGFGAGSIIAGDWNGDGIADLATADHNRGVVSAFPGLGSGGVGDGTFGARSDYAAGSVPIYLASADFNQDGHPDIAVTNKSSGSVSVLPGACVSPSPVLTAVRDVPGDQGGKVFVTWLRSALDQPIERAITGYRVWRRIQPAGSQLATFLPATAAGSGAAEVLAVRAPGDAATVTYWEALVTLPAEGLEGYGYTAPTTRDSTLDGNPYTAFFVSALTSDPYTFYQSNVDSGYSVDNLPPPAPVPFAAIYGGTSTALHWAASRAPDLLEFRLYRGPSAGFTVGASTLVAATRDTAYVDAAGPWYYKLAAVDVHGNTSAYAAVSPEQPTAALATLVSVDAGDDRIRLTWYSPGNAGAATVYRRTAASEWESLGEIAADGGGYYRYEDRAVTAGARYGYRLGIMDAGEEVLAGEVWATAERHAFGLEAVRPNPARTEDLTVEFILPTAEAARLELFDVAGRRVAAQDVASLGPGRHRVNMAAGARLTPGVYRIRLTQGAGVRIARAAVLR
ncbi:MAG TPA: FG-GAP-like repeat-containing protein [Candidatus Eisenbacteria bacterium]|jgi:hypothetical protein